MVRQIDWSDEAITDLIGIRDYLLQKTPGNTEAIIRRIQRAAEVLPDFPNAHRMRSALLIPFARFWSQNLNRFDLLNYALKFIE